METDNGMIFFISWMIRSCGIQFLYGWIGLGEAVLVVILQHTTVRHLSILTIFYYGRGNFGVDDFKKWSHDGISARSYSVVGTWSLNDLRWLVTCYNISPSATKLKRTSISLSRQLKTSLERWWEQTKNLDKNWALQKLSARSKGVIALKKHRLATSNHTIKYQNEKLAEETPIPWLHVQKTPKGYYNPIQRHKGSHLTHAQYVTCPNAAI